MLYQNGRCIIENRSSRMILIKKAHLIRYNRIDHILKWCTLNRKFLRSTYLRDDGQASQRNYNFLPLSFSLVLISFSHQWKEMIRRQRNWQMVVSIMARRKILRVGRVLFATYFLHFSRFSRASTFDLNKTL